MSDDSDVEILKDACPLSDGANDLSDVASHCSDAASDNAAENGSELDAPEPGQAGALFNALAGLQPEMNAAGCAAWPSASSRFELAAHQSRGGRGLDQRAASLNGNEYQQMNSSRGSRVLCSPAQATQPRPAVPQPVGDGRAAATELWEAPEGFGDPAGFMDSGGHLANSQHLPLTLGAEGGPQLRSQLLECI